MALLPNRTEMLILPDEAEVVCGKLLLATRLVENNQLSEAKDHHLFNGWIGKDFKFKISRRTRHAEHYLPLISGSIEPTSVGCIVFIKYSLFYSTAFLFWCWMCLTLVGSLIFTVIFQEYLYGGVSALSGLLYYILLMVNFGMQVKKDRATLNQLLT